MTNSLADILKDRQPQEPPEISIIKNFVREEFQADCTVLMQVQQIIIQVRSAALAGALRPHLYSLKEVCDTDKRLVIRIC